MRLLIIACLLMVGACVEPVSQKLNTVTGEPGDLKVIPPQNCPDWSKVDGNGGSNFGNTPDSNYGCATVTNFGAMIDDPRDMIVGKSSNLTSGARSSVSVTQYEAGPTAGGGSSGGASSSAPSSP